MKAAIMLMTRNWCLHHPEPSILRGVEYLMDILTRRFDYEVFGFAPCIDGDTIFHMDIYNMVACDHWYQFPGDIITDATEVLFVLGLVGSHESNVLRKLMARGKIKDVFAIRHQDHCRWKANRFTSSGKPMCEKHIASDLHCSMHNGSLGAHMATYWPNKEEWQRISYSGTTTTSPGYYWYAGNYSGGSSSTT